MISLLCWKKNILKYFNTCMIISLWTKILTYSHLTRDFHFFKKISQILSTLRECNLLQNMKRKWYDFYQSLKFNQSLDGKESACKTRDPSSSPGSGRSPGEGNGNPPQYFYLENCLDRGAWRSTAHRVAKSTGHDWVTDTHREWDCISRFQAFRCTNCENFQKIT